MNECFIMGKIVSEIRFDFILNSSNISVVEFEVELENKSNIKVIGYNEIADFCYNKLLKEDSVIIYGKINNEMEIIIKEIYFLFKI